MARPSTPDLPNTIRDLICEFAGYTAFTHDLNFVHLPVYPLDEYPDRLFIEDYYCFHDIQGEISRREDAHTLIEYWEAEYDRFGVSQQHEQTCEEPACGSMTNQSWTYHFHDRYAHPELFRIMLPKIHIRICQGGPGGFKPFFNLRGYVLAELRTLTVSLDGAPPESITLGGDWMRLKHLTSFNLRTRNGKSAMKEWEKLVRRLAQYITPHRLTLYVVAQAPDIETAKAILKPLDMLPVLKGCGLYLNDKPISEFIALAKETIRRLSLPPSAAPTAPAAPFRYSDLPQELRCRILQFSDLVSEADLEWKPSLSSLVPITTSRCTCDLHEDWMAGISRPLVHLPDCTERVLGQPAIRHSFKDWNAASYRNESYRPEHCCIDCYDSGWRSLSYRRQICWKDDTGFCACHYQCLHSAYTNTVTEPRAGAHPLFLVSRSVRQDAIPVFFKQNKFVITPPWILPIRDIASETSVLFAEGIPMRCTELSIFLSLMPPNALRYIRYLEWVLPPTTCYTSAAKSCFYDYLDAIEMMPHAMHLGQLTLVLNFRAVGCIWDYDGWWNSDREVWPERRDKDITMYNAVLGPLCRLKGLKDCFIYLKRMRSSLRLRREHAACIFDSNERRYERAIMGSNYDSSKSGKPWMERYERMVCKRPCTGRYDKDM